MCTQIVKVRIQWDKDFNNIASNIQVTSMSYNFLHRGLKKQRRLQNSYQIDRLNKIHVISKLLSLTEPGAVWWRLTRRLRASLPRHRHASLKSRTIKIIIIYLHELYGCSSKSIALTTKTNIHYYVISKRSAERSS